MGEERHLGQPRCGCEKALPWWMPGEVEGAWEMLGSWLRLPSSSERGSLYFVTPMCAQAMTKPPCRGVEEKQARPAEPRWCRILILHSL